MVNLLVDDRKVECRKWQKKSRATAVMVRLPKKRSIRVSSDPAEQHHPLHRVTAPDAAGTT
jgi:hypothetical protein